MHMHMHRNCKCTCVAHSQGTGGQQYGDLDTPNLCAQLGSERSGAKGTQHCVHEQWFAFDEAARVRPKCACMACVQATCFMGHAMYAWHAITQSLCLVQR
jgi:hypothetical protein